MKKKIIAALLAVTVLCACMPLFSGCNVQVDYTLNEDENGNKYYSVSVSGYGDSLTGDYVIPSEYGEGDEVYPVTEIAESGFSGTRISSVTIPSSVTSIGSAAFAYCYSLTTVIFEEGTQITRIPQGAFAYCTRLETITVPESVTLIGAMAFYYDEALTEITIPSSVVDIYPRAFEYCTALASVTLNEGLEYIGYEAFYGCSALEEITVPSTVYDYVETSADDDGNVTEYYVYGLGIAAFHSCTSLKKAVIKGNINTLAAGTFGYCTALEEVYLPASITTIEGAYYDSSDEFYCGHAFAYCASLTDVYFAGSEDDWNAIDIYRTSVYEDGYTYDNSYLLSAAMHYNYAE